MRRFTKPGPATSALANASFVASAYATTVASYLGFRPSFITHKETPWLDGKHAVFGYVTEGQDVVNAIVMGDKMEQVTIERVGKAAKAWDAMKVLADNKDKFRAK